MHDRNVLSLVKGFARFALLPLASLTIGPASADGGNPGFPLISMLSPGTAMPLAGMDNALVVHEFRASPTVARTVDLTAISDDLWLRLRNGFAMTNLNDDLTLHYQQWYQNRPDALRRMVERSRPYLHYIVEELEARHADRNRTAADGRKLIQPDGLFALPCFRALAIHPCNRQALQSGAELVAG